jgi:hypothetical protein
MSKALSLGLGFVIAAAAAAPAPAQSSVERLIAQERAKGLISKAEPVPQIIAQEQGRRADARIFGPQRPAVVQVVRRSGGFDWGDAGIGGAAALGLAFLGAAGVALLRERRHAPKRVGAELGTAGS